jgi:NAD(P)-dependent dehydrogenase (short-subunit alcohol dehydrogenase family)
MKIKISKLAEVQKVIEKKGQHAVSVVCGLSDIASTRNAAKEITELDLPIAGLINNAGIYQLHATKNPLGWDMTFASCRGEMLTLLRSSATWPQS